ncbi:MAG: hypothetical protein PF694_05400 [Bacteroidetes bacterium]|jgi:hypothetical protein|nr:hypothetical protein [Bacteroidota bacterium]
MNNKTVQEFFGTLTKEESLQCMESGLIIKDSCVLESKNPFFGYYDDAPKVQKPRYLYLILDKPIGFVDIQRIIQQIKKSSSINIDAVLAEISTPNHPDMPALRLRDLPQYGQLSIVQQEFRDAGLVFKKHSKETNLEHALITLEKFFFLEIIEEGIYFDARQAHHGYFIIPEYIDWDVFKDLTRKAKYEPSLLSFDAARASIFENNQLIELVRIYRENIDLSLLKAYRDRYYHLLGL